MKKSGLSRRDAVMLVFLVALVISVVYYMGFYTPLQNEMNTIARQADELDNSINAVSAQLSRMDAMQAELDEIFQKPSNEITEIAPYDNKEVVLNQLYGILSQTQDYSLDFTDPAIGADGTVRRNISLTFTCATYPAAKAVLTDLTESHWRCLISNLKIDAAEGSLVNDAVSVTVTMTFFEHTGLS